MLNIVPPISLYLERMGKKIDFKQKSKTGETEFHLAKLAQIN